MIRDFFGGVAAYFRAQRFIIQHRLWPILVLPGLLSLGLILLLLSSGILWFDDFSAYLNSVLLPESWQNSIALVITNIFSWIIALLAAYMTYKHIVLIILAPVLGYLSEKVEELSIAASPPAFSFRQMFSDLNRGLRINLRNLLLTLGLTIPAWLTVFIPVIGIFLSPTLLFVIQAYYGGFGLLDVTLERRRFDVRSSREFISNHRARAIGLGTGFLLILLIPFVGWFAAPTYGIVAATLSAIDHMPGPLPSEQEVSA